MNAKEAVKTAIQYISDVFANERVENIGLEEVEYIEGSGEWEITIGMSRPWHYPPRGIIENLQQTRPKRQYKVVTVDDQTGEVRSIKIREIPDA